MAEHPILMSGPMVRAILDGRKTQTRRVIKLPPAPDHLGKWEPATLGGPGVYLDVLHTRPAPVVACLTHTRTGKTISCPYGQPGDVLWVRETYFVRCAGNMDGSGRDIVYRANDPDFPYGWTPSIHMPRWASRINLEIVSVQPERLQEISLADIQAEGIPDDRATFNAPNQQAKFRDLWNQINGKPRPVKGGDRKVDHYVSYPWDDIQETRTYRGKPWYVCGNPWVWRIEFKRQATT